MRYDVRECTRVVLLERITKDTCTSGGFVLEIALTELSFNAQHTNFFCFRIHSSR